MAYKKIDPSALVGTRCHRLLIESIAYKKNSAWYYNCKCDCGTTTIVVRGSLLHQQQKSCGCLFKELMVKKSAAQKGKPSLNAKSAGQSSFNILLRRYKNGAKERKIGFFLSKEKFKVLVDDVCYYCGTKPQTLIQHPCAISGYLYNGIDRVNSNKDYTEDNCVTCCKVCNYMKHELAQEDFYFHIRKILNHVKIPDSATFKK